MAILDIGLLSSVGDQQPMQTDDSIANVVGISKETPSALLIVENWLQSAHELTVGGWPSHCCYSPARDASRATCTMWHSDSSFKPQHSLLDDHCVSCWDCNGTDTPFVVAENLRKEASLIVKCIIFSVITCMSKERTHDLCIFWRAGRTETAGIGVRCSGGNSTGVFIYNLFCDACTVQWIKPICRSFRQRDPSDKVLWVDQDHAECQASIFDVA